MNAYAGYHVLHGGVDPSGLVIMGSLGPIPPIFEWFAEWIFPSPPPLPTYGKTFPYLDPDGLGSIADLRIEAFGMNICSSANAPYIEVVIQVQLIPTNLLVWGGVQKYFTNAAKNSGYFLINNNVVEFEQIPLHLPQSDTVTAHHKISLPRCPEGKQQGSIKISVIDRTREGTRWGFFGLPIVYSGVAQKYRIDWSYKCTQRGGACCLDESFRYDVHLLESSTRHPNLSR